MRGLRRAILTLACLIHRRFTLHIKAFPWRLATLGDPRASADEKNDMWQDFLDTMPCCLPPGMSRTLQARAKASPDPVAWSKDPAWQEACLWWGRLLTLTSADVEFRHARNRSGANKYGQTGMEQFAAKYVHHEAATTFVAANADAAFIAGQGDEGTRPAWGGNGNPPSLHRSGRVEAESLQPTSALQTSRERVEAETLHPAGGGTGPADLVAGALAITALPL